MTEDPQVFVDEILPHIQDASAGQLSRATGLSRSYCLDVRRGNHVPHPRHWEGFRLAITMVDGSTSGPEGISGPAGPPS